MMRAERVRFYRRESMIRNTRFWTIISIVFIATIVFWIRNLYRTEVHTIPDKIIVGTAADYPPFTFKKDGSIVGLDIDVAREVARRLKRDMVFREMPFKLLIPQANEGNIQIIAAGITPTKKRGEYVIFTTPYVTQDSLALMTRASGPSVKSVQDLEGKRVLINEGYTADEYLSALPNVTLIRMPTGEDAVRALMKKEGDVFVAALSSLKPITEQYGTSAFAYAFIEDTAENIALGISRKYPELAEEVVRIVDEMLKDGTIDTLKTKWLGQ